MRATLMLQLSFEMLCMVAVVGHRSCGLLKNVV